MNKNTLTEDELKKITGGTIDDSNIADFDIYKHYHPKCGATFATPWFVKPRNCPECGRPDSPEGPIKKL